MQDKTNFARIGRIIALLALPVVIITVLILSLLGGQSSQVFDTVNQGLYTGDGSSGSGSSAPEPAAAPTRQPAPQAAERASEDQAVIAEEEEAADTEEMMDEEAASEEMAGEAAEAEMDTVMDTAAPTAPQAAMPAAPPAPQAPQAVQSTPAPTAPAAETDMDTSQDDELTGEEEPPPPTVTPQEVEVHPFTATVDDPLSTFAMDVDTASYSAARNYLLNSALPPVGTVRVEEFVNYFDYGYPNPQEGAFHIAVDGAPSPFTSDTQIVRVGIQGEQIDESQRDNAILTFVIDVSGSMDTPDRLPLVKEALTLLVEQLREGDQVAIVVYSDDTRVVLEPTSATQRDVIISAINSLQIEDSTNVEAGLRLGYQLAGEHFQNGAINRVILCSDGVANVGATGPEAIRQSIRDYAAQGVLLTTVGFGMNTYNDYLMEQLANDGNGNYAYVDTRSEAERVFVENLTGTLQVIARDAKIQVAFNPEVVSQYRLLGYENRAVADEDFRNDDVDAGEVGAGHSVTALYEVRLTGQGTGEALVVQVRYEDPESGEVIELQEPLQSDEMVASFEAAPTNMQLAVAVAGLAENLRGTGYAQDRPLSAILEIAQRLEPQFANDADVSEFVELVRRAQNLTR